MNTSDRDPQLWQMAKARTRFKMQLITYLLVNGLLWGIWLATNVFFDRGRNLFPWPIFPTVFWGFGVLVQGLTAYQVLGKRLDWSEREYERLQRQRAEGRF